jgi:hypothetical protein
LAEAMAMSAGGRSIHPVMVSSNKKNMDAQPIWLCHLISQLLIRAPNDECGRGAKE